MLKLILAVLLIPSFSVFAAEAPPSPTDQACQKASIGNRGKCRDIAKQSALLTPDRILACGAATPVGMDFIGCLNIASSSRQLTEKKIHSCAGNLKGDNFMRCLQLASDGPNRTTDQIDACTAKQNSSLGHNKVACVRSAKSDLLTPEKINACGTHTKLGANFLICTERAAVDPSFDVSKIVACGDHASGANLSHCYAIVADMGLTAEQIATCTSKGWYDTDFFDCLTHARDKAGPVGK